MGVRQVVNFGQLCECIFVPFGGGTKDLSRALRSSGMTLPWKKKPSADGFRGWVC